MQISARNVLKGKVTKIVTGAVNTEITLELPGGLEIVSVVTKESAEKMSLDMGSDVYAVIKASNVMLATD